MKKLHHQIQFVGSVFLLCLVAADPIQAEIIPDATLGNESSAVTPNVVINRVVSDRIDGGAIRGANLFHSFQEFNVSQGRGVYFTNLAGIENILSRVTGSNGSNIQGRLGVLGNANLFLINPNGIVFGPNAQLDVSGSFLGSTASSINLADGTQFSATTATPSLLTISVPIGLQFGANVGTIRNQSVALNSSNMLVGLQVLPNRTLALVGGDVALEGGSLTAPSGRIEIGSVASTGLVSLNSTDEGWILGYEGGQFQDIQLSQGTFPAVVNASGEGGGNIQVQGRQVAIANGSRIVATNDQGASPGGNISVNASESVELIGSTVIGGRVSPSALSTLVEPGSMGSGGNLTIETGRLTIRDGAQASTSTEGAGKAGNLTVRASAVELVGTSEEGFASSLSATAREQATGAGGNLTIETGQLLVQDGAQVAVTTFGNGDAGNLLVRASEVRLLGSAPSSVPRTGVIVSGLFAGTEPETKGNGGNLTIETERLIVQDGAEAQTTTLGDGNAGSLVVRASESVQLRGKTPDSRFPSALLSVSGLENVFTEAKGQGGSIQIDTPQLLVQDGAEVTVSSTSTASDASSAGNIDITAQTIRLDQGAIAAETASGNGGNITLHNPDLLLLRRQSNISTSAGTAGAGGTGGNINIDNAQFIVAIPAENSDIKANAFLGQGGKVTINAQSILGLAERNLEDLQTLLNTNDPTQLDPINLSSSDITAISQTDPSLSGQVTINTPDIDPSRGLVTLPTDVVDASGLIAQGCASDAASIARNVFIITGRGGLPPSPTETLSGETLLTNWATLEPQFEHRSSAEGATNATRVTAPTQIVEAQGWAINSQGEVILTASAPTVTSNSPMTLTSCHSSSSVDTFSR